MDFLPAMQRRRLGALARMVFACAWPLAEGRANLPVVYGSQHGETTRDIELLLDLARGEPLSPTSFGLSVHNAVAGQWTIARGETAETVALSAAHCGAEHAFLEACALLRQGYEAALVVLAEELPPAPYRPWIADVPFSYAAAFRIEPGQDWRLAPSDPPACSPAPAWPSPLNLVRNLALGSPGWHHIENGHAWQWTHLDR
ncbi:beta-ketoacyl synthase chain length factor [Pigmentiphaga humi]|uniref:beta-ketoacyl synthase chain length factor n=1 Tax=Pigmentiphaga humi TaxID=2478468 RepID=UPI001FEC3483|nr:beta-ketoacyl synthase chain length factor [Pigmentiphaga humi]